MAFIVFLLALGTALRLTRLVTHDTITEPIRDFFARSESRGARFVTKLLQCPWCAGFWISLATSIAALDVAPIDLPTWFVLPALTLTTSYLVGAVSTAMFTLEIWEPPGSPNRH